MRIMNIMVRFRIIGCILLTLLMAWFGRSLPVTSKGLLTSSQAGAKSEKAPSKSDQSNPKAKYESVVLIGMVVELGPQLMQKYQMPMDDDLGKNVMVLLTDTGELHPLIKDLRSRGYWMDKRLRDRQMELHVHKFPGLPFVRLIDAYSIKEGKRYRVDYWCSVCAITTFEPGPCPCCQEEIQLREVLIEP